MKRPHPQPALPVTLAAVLAAMAVAGCAGMPRIDPSGDRVLIFPDGQPTVVQAAPPGTIVAPPGNVLAPPALSSGSTASPSSSSCCPLCPLCPLGGSNNSPQAIGVEPPTDRVTLTPGRVLAPVGTEVVLRAGVCGKDGYLLTNRKIEWMLGQEGAGQFATIGEEGERDIGRFPWSTPKKIDNHYALGYTAPFHTCLRRGTEDPSDDVQIKSGESWVTVTSASEGTSYITALAPDAENWNARRAQATIYWVDAQWQLPPSAMIGAGQPHQLTTLITRQTDGAPIAGWIVRYEVADTSGARLGYEAGQAAEVTTDNRGRATVEVTPTDSRPGTSLIRVTVVRPEQAGVASSPRLDVGAGQTQVTWSNTAPGTQPLLPPVGPPIPPPSLPPGPPPTRPPSGPTEPPIGIVPPTGRPELQLRVRRVTPDPIKVSDRVAYSITISNVGDGVARNVVLRAKFDSGLTSQYDQDGAGEIENKNVGDIPPKGSKEIPLDFDVLAAGSHYQEVTVTADGVSPEFERVTFEAITDRPVTPSIRLQTGLSPVKATVGKTTLFTATIENIGTTPAEGLEFFISADPALAIAEGTTGSAPAPGGGFVFRLEPLAPAAKRVLKYSFTCERATEVGRPAQIRAFVKGSGVNEAGSQSIEIVPPVVPPPGAAPLSLSITSDRNPAPFRQSANLLITVQNDRQQPLQNVQVQLSVPQGVAPRLNGVQSPPGTTLTQAGPVLSLNPPIPQLPPGGRVQLTVPYDAVQQGDATIDAAATWAGATGWVTGRVVVRIQP